MKLGRVWIEPLDRPLSRHELRQLRAVWDDVPHVRCKGLCAASCQRVPLFPVEAFFLIEKHGAEIAPGAHPGGHGKEPGSTTEGYIAPTLGPTGPCQYLKDGRCSIYEDRPLICRVFGHPTATLTCSHGCVVKKPLDPYRLGLLFLRVARITNPDMPTVFRTNEEFRAGFDALHQQWEDMMLLAEDLGGEQ